MPVPIPKMRRVPPPPVQPPELVLANVPVYMREFVHVWVYSTPQFYSASLEHKLVLAGRCERNARHAMQLLYRDRLRIAHFRDFREWVRRHNRMKQLITFHKSACTALLSHMYQPVGDTNGHIE